MNFYYSMTLQRIVDEFFCLNIIVLFLNPLMFELGVTILSMHVTFVI